MKFYRVVIVDSYGSYCRLVTRTNMSGHDFDTPSDSIWVASTKLLLYFQNSLFENVFKNKGSYHPQFYPRNTNHTNFWLLREITAVKDLVENDALMHYVNTDVGPLMDSSVKTKWEPSKTFASGLVYF